MNFFFHMARLCPLQLGISRQIHYVILFCIFYSGHKFRQCNNILPYMSTKPLYVLCCFTSTLFLLPHSCSICKKKQNSHFIVPKDDFTLLEVIITIKLWVGTGGWEAEQDSAGSRINSQGTRNREKLRKM